MSRNKPVTDGESASRPAFFGRSRRFTVILILAALTWVILCILAYLAWTTFS